MIYNFDEPVNRRNTQSVKYDLIAANNKPEDTIPLWVADMDFQAPPAVSERLKVLAEHNIYGYSFAGEGYFQALNGWFSRRFGWETQESWLIRTPGVVFAISNAIRAYTDPGDGVLIQAPVYPPFAKAAEVNGRRVVKNLLVLRNGRYEIDFADFERKIRDEKVRLFALCSPHNPVGRVWSEDELRRMGEICLRYNVIIVSDEIHADFVFAGNEHKIFANLDPRFASRSVICTAASKTFNLAGLQCANIFIPDEKLRERFNIEQEKTSIHEINRAGMLATQAAYEEGEEWLDQLKIYLAANLSTVRGFLKSHLPEVKLIEPEGTYLLWLDFRELGLEQDDLIELLTQQARLWMHDGRYFGDEGNGFMRMNIACPRATLKEALERLEKAIR